MDGLGELRDALQELSDLRRTVYSTTQLSTVSRACQNLVEYCTQKLDPFFEGFEEVNPWKRSANKSEPEASKRSRDIDQLLTPSNRAQVVCLAAPETGFDEMLRKINVGRPFSTTELDEYKRYLKQNLLTVLRHVAKLAGSSISESNKKLHKKLLRDEYGTNFDGIMTTTIAESLRTLWTDPAVQHIYNSIKATPFVTDLIGHLTIEGILKYIEHLQDPSFTPTLLDATHYYDHATGIREVHLQDEQYEGTIQLLDFTNLPVVGEGEFCKHTWAAQFQNATFIFCYVPLHTYDEKIDHEAERKPMRPPSHIYPDAVYLKRTVTDYSLPTPIPSNNPVSNMMKSPSAGGSLPSFKPFSHVTKTRANSTNARYSVSTASPKASKLHTNKNNPHQIIGFNPPPSTDTQSDPNPQRKSLYRYSNSMSPNFVRRTVQLEKKGKTTHIAALHRLLSSVSSSSSPSASSSNSAPLLPDPSSPPSPPITPSPSSSGNSLHSTSTSPPSSPSISPTNTSANVADVVRPKSRKPNGSFLIITSPPPSPPPSSPPNSIPSSSSSSLFGKVANRKSWESILAPFTDRQRSSTQSLLPNPPSPSVSPTNSFLAPSSRKSERISVSYGSMPPLSLVALPASPTLADIFKLPCYLKRFSALVNEESLTHVPVLIAFVASSAFSEKIKEVDLDVCFPEYEGDHTEQSALDYIKKIFTEQNANPTRKIITCVLQQNDNEDPTNEVKNLLRNAVSTQMYQ